MLDRIHDATSRRAALALLLALCVTAGCDDEAVDDPVRRFAEALPTSDLLALDVPGEETDTTDGALSVVAAPLLGEPSSLRALTSGVRHYLTALILSLTEGVERMTNGRPLRRTDDGAVWRVRFPAAGDERALVMHKEENHFVFSLWTRKLAEHAEQAGPWGFLIFGRITPAGDGDGRGAMWIDLDHDRKPLTRGKMSVLWSIIGDRREIEVTVFNGTPDENQIGRLTRNYRYQDGPDGGVLAFDAGDVDVHLAPDHQARERVRVFTRWNAARTVRSNYSAIGPEVRADGFRVLIGSECWQLPDARVGYETRLGIPLSGGAPVTLFEAGDRGVCPFAEEEAPIVAPPGSAPLEPPRPVEITDLEAPDAR